MAQRAFPLRIVAWEVTRNCNLNCIHCRASATSGPYQDELPISECKTIIDGIASFASPIVILTGGEPLLRSDIFDIIEYGTQKGLKMAIAINGTLLDRTNGKKLKSKGIQRVSLSIDGNNETSHDTFRGVSGSYSAVMNAAGILKDIALPFQINTTVTQLNAGNLEEIYSLVKTTGAVAWHIFLLVPVGRGEGLKGQELTARMYEKTLQWFFEIGQEGSIELKVTCAPHYNRIVKQQGGMPRGPGCLAGKGFMFISHKGIAQPCGYLEIPSGDVRHNGVQRVWEESPVFLKLRNLSSYKGKCGGCRYLSICGGCRARAFEMTGDFLEEEPLCLYKQV